MVKNLNTVHKCSWICNQNTFVFFTLRYQLLKKFYFSFDPVDDLCLNFHEQCTRHARRFVVHTYTDRKNPRKLKFVDGGEGKIIYNWRIEVSTIYDFHITPLTNIHWIFNFRWFFSNSVYTVHLNIDNQFSSKTVCLSKTSKPEPEEQLERTATQSIHQIAQVHRQAVSRPARVMDNLNMICTHTTASLHTQPLVCTHNR